MHARSGAKEQVQHKKRSLLAMTACYDIATSIPASAVGEQFRPFRWRLANKREGDGAPRRPGSFPDTAQ
jgi:hypothetical protein